MDLRCDCCEMILELQLKLSLFHISPATEVADVPPRESSHKGNIFPVPPYGSDSSVLGAVKRGRAGGPIPQPAGRGKWFPGAQIPPDALSGDGFVSHGQERAHACNCQSSVFLKKSLAEARITYLLPNTSPLYVKQSSQTHVNKIFCIAYCLSCCLFVCVCVSLSIDY